MSMPERHFGPINFKHRFPALDGLRALAVTMVFLEHYGGGSHGGKVLSLFNDLLQYFWIGVDLFFVLSGFLITGILFDTRADSKFFQRFFARRSVRIFPVFYLVLVVLLVLTPILHLRWRWGQLTFLVYLGNFFANYNWDLYGLKSTTSSLWALNLGHFWSLCVEEQFYLIWPLVVWFVRDRVKLIRVSLALIVGVIASRVLLLHFTDAEVAMRWAMRCLPFRMDSLLVGAILALLLRGPNADRWQRLSRWFFLAGSAVSLAIFNLFPAGTVGFLSVALTFVALACAGLIGMTLRQGSPAFRIFHRKPLLTLGKYSYGFYIYHAIFQWPWIMFLVFAFNHFHSLWIAGIVALGLNFTVTFLVSKISYDFFEVRFLRLKKGFEYDSEQKEHRHAFVTR